ncbi:hypothetical protein TPY_3734 [Sulfobacillus acidophilus TPY]|nr:hypothetical protein TPY_3734 [Sulfobacillus acidophilus TPY]
MKGYQIKPIAGLIFVNHVSLTMVRPEKQFKAFQMVQMGFGDRYISQGR